MMAGFCTRRVTPYWRTYVLVLTPLVFMPLPILGGTPGYFQQVTLYPQRASFDCGHQGQEARCGYGIIVMAIYWMTEALPLPVTSLLPVVIFPLFGILSTDAACKQYLKETNMMFIGGLMVAIAVEHCCLHKRIALKVLLTIGTGPKRLMIGFMLVTMFLSMWISNTATTAMMMPIVEAVLDELFRVGPVDDKDTDQLDCSGKSDTKQKGIYLVPTCETTLYDSKDELNNIDVNVNTIPISDAEWKSNSNGTSKTTIAVDAVDRAEEAEIREAHRTEKRLYRTVVMLSVAYSANIGGTGTMTGSGPNLVLKGMLSQRYGSASGLNFATWMLFGVPTMLLCIAGAFIWLMFLYTCRRPKIAEQEDNSKFVKGIIRKKYDDLGPISFHEVGVLVLFILVVVLWFFRDPQFIDGWMHFFPAVEVDDASAAILVCLLFFSVPAAINFWCFKKKLADGEEVQEKPGPTLLEWKVVQQKMPWGVVILLGGGFSMAEASKVSGLSRWMGQQLLPLQVLPPAAIAFVVSIMTAAFTEVTSNVATATVLLPVLADLATSLKVHPLYLMFPATITCSYAFMLPIATPPNAIAFSSGHMKSQDMLFPGLFMNIICVGVITLTINTLGVAIFDLNTFPEWAGASNVTAALAAIKS